MVNCSTPIEHRRRARHAWQAVVVVWLVGASRDASADLGASVVAGGIDVSTAEVLHAEPQDARVVQLQPHVYTTFSLASTRHGAVRLDATLGLETRFRSTDAPTQTAGMAPAHWYQADLVSGVVARLPHGVAAAAQFVIKTGALSEFEDGHEVLAQVSWRGGARGPFTGFAPTVVVIREDHAIRRGTATGGFAGASIAPGLVARVPSATVTATLLAEVGVATGAYQDDPLRGDRSGCLAAGARVGVTLDRVPRRLGSWTFTVQTRAYQRGGAMTSAGGDGAVVVATTVGLGVTM